MDEDTGDVLSEDMTLETGGAIAVQGRRADKQIALYIETLTRPLPEGEDVESPPCGGASMFLYLSLEEAEHLRDLLSSSVAFARLEESDGPV